MLCSFLLCTHVRICSFASAALCFRFVPTCLNRFIKGQRSIGTDEQQSHIINILQNPTRLFCGWIRYVLRGATLHSRRYHLNDMSQQQEVPALPPRPQSFQSPASTVPYTLQASPVSPPPRLPPRKSDVRVQALSVLPSSAEIQGSVNTALSSSPTRSVVSRSRLAERYANDPIPRLEHEQIQALATESEGRDGDDSKRALHVAEREAEDSRVCIPVEQSTIPTTPAPADPIPQLQQVNTPQFFGDLPLPSLTSTVLVGFLVILAYSGASVLSLIMAAAGVYYLWADGQRREARRRRDPEEDREKVKGKVSPHAAMREESTEWL